MTPANLLILDDKDTGDLRGDLTFNLMETAIPIECNHVLDNTTAGDCTGQSTHSWLLNKDLVYSYCNARAKGACGSDSKN